MAGEGQVVPLPPRHAGLCSFMKLGVRVPARGCRLFVKLFVLAAACSMALFIVRSLALQPLAAKIVSLDLDVGTDAFATIVRRFLSDNQWLLLGGAGCLVADAVLGLAIKIAIVFAAISACHQGHDDLTLASLLGRIKRNAWGPVVTASFGFVLQVTAYAATVVSAMLAFIFKDLYSQQMLAVHLLLQFGALFLLLYLELVREVALVASAAEPGLRGASAVRRAWRLMRGAKAQVALCVVATWAAGWAISHVYNLTMLWLPHSAANGLIRMDAAVMFTLRVALDFFSVALVAAFYFLRTNSSDGVKRVKKE